MPTTRGERREREIIDAAAEVFARKGYAAATVEDIASAVGMLKGSLYYYVHSKEDLLYRLTLIIKHDALATIDDMRAHPGTAVDRLTTLVRMHFRRLPSNIAYQRVFYYEYHHLTGERYVEIVRVRDTLEQYVQQLVAEGQVDGEVCRRRDPRVMMIATLTLLTSVYQWYRPDVEDPEHLTDQYIAFVLGGLRCSSGGTCTCAPAATAERPTAKRRKRDEGVASS